MGRRAASRVSQPSRTTVTFLGLLLVLPAIVPLAGASPHDGTGPTYAADALVASWNNSISEATDGETVPSVVEDTVQDLDDNVRRPGQVGGEGLSLWPWGAQHPDYQDPPGLVLPTAFQSGAGHRLEADLWLPPSVALVDGELVAPEGQTYPGLVLTPGFTAGRSMYDWLLFRLQAEDYIVLAWDPQGQGTSHGPAATAADYERDLKRAIDWFHSGFNPAQPLFDGRFGLVGHSQGGNAAFWLGGDAGYADRVGGLVALSSSWVNGTPPSETGPVETVGFPVQAFTGDYDGGFVQPAYLGLNYGATDYEDLKPKYDAHFNGPKQLVVLEGATHDSWTNIPLVYGDGRTHELTWHYASAFLDRFVKDQVDQATYDRLATPVEGLSKAYPSQLDLAVETTRMTQGVAPSLGLDPQPFVSRQLGQYEHDCRAEATVTTAGGDPVPGATVTLVPSGDQLTTDQQGWAAFHHVPAVTDVQAVHPYAGPTPGDLLVSWTGSCP